MRETQEKRAEGMLFTYLLSQSDEITVKILFFKIDFLINKTLLDNKFTHID